MSGRPHPAIFAVDLGTSSVRTLCFDQAGVALSGSETQVPYAMEVTADGGVEIDADRLFEVLVSCVDRATARLDPTAHAVAAVGVTSFWHSLLGLDAAGRPATPLFSWADSRSAPDAAALRATHDGAAVLQRTGCRLHSSYWPAKLRWLARTRPETFARVAHWVSFADYAAFRLAPARGLRTGVSMASGTGLLDVHRLDWDGEALAMAGIDAATLPPIVDAADGVALEGEFARRWTPLADVPWLPALGDGACANVGSGAIGPGRIALTLGTSGAMRLVLPAPPGAA
jgi:gluconokinase